MRLSLIPLVLLITACETEVELTPPIGVWTAPEAATSSRVLPASGTAPVLVGIRAEGSWGAAVPGDVGSVTVNGTSQTLQADGGGVAVLSLSDVGVHEVAGENTVEVAVFAEDSTLDAMPRGLAQDEIIAAHPAAGGAIVQSDSAIWWVPTQGEAIPVLDVSGERLLGGSAVGNVDADGRADVLTWAGDTVVVLRSHAVAGHVLAGTIVGDGRTAVGAALDDVDGDGFSDIIIAWAEAPRHELEVWSGDGAYGFEVDSTIQLRRLPHSLSVGDNSGTGIPQITVLDDSNFWARYVASLNTYAQTGPMLGDVNFLPDSTSLSGDFNGDGAEELFVLGPVGDGVVRDMRMYDLTGDIIVTPFNSGAIGAELALGDSNRDGRVDVWMAQETGEVFLRRNITDVQEQRRVWTAPDAGPIAVHDQNGDGIPELFLAGGTFWDTAYGGVADFDGVSWWDPSENERVFEMGVSSVPVITRLDPENPRIDVIGTVESGTSIDLVVFGLFTGVTPLLSELNSTSVSTSGDDAVDVAVCDGTAFVLTTAELVTINVGVPVPVVRGRANVSGTQVACGDGPSGARAGVLDGTTVELFSAIGDSVGSETVVTAIDLALVGGNVEVCTNVGCGVGGLSDGAVVLTSDTELTIGDEAVPGSGRLAVGDFDDDGEEEVLVSDGGALIWLDTAGDRILVRERGYTDLVVDGPLVPADVFADGRLVLIGSRDGDLVVSTGTVLVPPVADEAR